MTGIAFSAVKQSAYILHVLGRRYRLTARPGDGLAALTFEPEQQP